MIEIFFCLERPGYPFAPFESIVWRDPQGAFFPNKPLYSFVLFWRLALKLGRRAIA
jgi:hypothetical protein